MYPKIKIKKVKLKLSINDIFDNIKAIIFKYISMFKSKENFVLFLKKNFHF